MIKIFMVNEYGWYAAETEEEAIKKAMEESEEDRDSFDKDTEVNEEMMNKLIYHDYDGTKKTFKEKLKEIVDDGGKFPCFFAGWNIKNWRKK